MSHKLLSCFTISSHLENIKYTYHFTYVENIKSGLFTSRSHKWNKLNRLRGLTSSVLRRRTLACFWKSLSSLINSYCRLRSCKTDKDKLWGSQSQRTSIIKSKGKKDLAARFIEWLYDWNAGLRECPALLKMTFTYLLLQLQHFPVLLALPVSEFVRVVPHLPHQLCPLGLHGLWEHRVTVLGFGICGFHLKEVLLNINNALCQLSAHDDTMW